MITKAYINKTREYLDYLERHIDNVEKAWKLLCEKCPSMRFVYDDFVWGAIDHAVKAHDVSKLTEKEFVQYRRKFFPTEYEVGEWIELEFQKAWKNHEKENSHHWQNWTKKKSGSPYEWEIDCVHMVIDWVAMGFEFGDTAQSYYEKNKDKIDLPEYAIAFIYEIFDKVYA